MRKTFLSTISTLCLTSNTIGSEFLLNFLEIPTPQKANQEIKLTGPLPGIHLGYQVSAGDINADGFSDILIAAYTNDPSENPSAGMAYVLYGSKDNLFEVNLNNLTPSQGFTITSSPTIGSTGISLVGAGDINGDGIDDIIFGDSNLSPEGRNEAGATFIIFGSRHGLSNVDLTNLTSSQGFQIIGAKSGDRIGSSISGVGDVNGDGIGDFIIGSYPLNPNDRHQTRVAYVVLGTWKGFSNIDLGNFSSSQGFTIVDATIGDYNDITLEVNTAGDINGDGLDDIILGAPYFTNAGRAYVIYGNRSQTTEVDVRNLDPSQGFQIIGGSKDGNLGNSVSGADMNGDGINDLILGAWGSSPFDRYAAGATYIIYGSTQGFLDIELDNLTSTEGFRITGAKEYDEFGSSASVAGDVNGDGIDDIIIGAVTGSPEKHDYVGAAYVIFGSRDGFEDIDVKNLSPSQGVEISGSVEKDGFGGWVSSAGDVNGDGFDDVIIGASGTSSGAVYVLLSPFINSTESVVTYF